MSDAKELANKLRSHADGRYIVNSPSYRLLVQAAALLEQQAKLAEVARLFDVGCLVFEESAGVQDCQCYGCSLRRALNPRDVETTP